MKAGGYELHLSCDHKGCPYRNYEYVGEHKRQAFEAARGEGWHIGKPWTAPDFCKNHKPRKEK